MKQRITAALLTCCLLATLACTQKPATDPTATARFHSIAARAGRVAAVYTPAALDALPMVAATLKWDSAKQESVKAILIKGSGQRRLDFPHVREHRRLSDYPGSKGADWATAGRNRGRVERTGRAGIV